MYINNLKNKLRHRGLVAFLLFVGIATTYMASVRTWGFEAEDFYFLYRASQTHTPNDFLDIFVHGSMHHLYGTASHVELLDIKAQSFFTVDYRPLFIAAVCLQYKLFGNNEYGYLAVSILFHAFVAVLVFYLLLLFMSSIGAALGALFFAFHPTLAYWLGKIDLLHHNLVLMFALFSMIAFYWWVKTDRWRYFFLIFISFFLSIMSRETFIVLPWVLLCMLPWIGSKRSVRHVVLWSFFGFFFVFIIYCLLRQIGYPLVMGGGAVEPFPSIQYDMTSLLSICIRVFNFFYELFWLLLFPWCTYDFFKIHNALFFYKILKAMILVSGAYLFVTNRQKGFVVLMLVLAICLLWPLLLAPYGGQRFYYEALPFFVMAYSALIYFSSVPHGIKKCVGLVVVALVIINALFVVSCMRHTAQLRRETKQQLVKLKKSSVTLQNRPVFIFGRHQYHFDLVYALELYGITSKMPHFFYRELTIAPKNASASMFVVNVMDNCLRIVTKNKDCAWLELVETERPVFLENIVIDAQDPNEQGRIFDITIYPKKQCFFKDMCVLAFSKPEQEFIVLA